MREEASAARALAVLLAVGALACAAGAAGALPSLVDIGPLLRPVLFVAAALLAIIATLLWQRQPRVRAADVALVALSLCVALALLEAGVRLRERMANLNGEIWDREDATLGWTLESGVHAVQRGHRYTTTADGLRARLNRGAPRKVLVIGDSYTQAVQVDDDSSYWAQLAHRRPDLEIVVLGVGGYATLQEAMQLERLVPTEHPALIIWQLCGNDLIGNDFGLEAQSLWNNNARRRPYLEGDSVVVRNPRPAPSLESSALWRVVASHVAVLRAEQLGARTVEMELDRHPAEVMRARTATRASIDRGRRAAGRTPVVAFLVDDDDMAREIAAVARDAGLTLLPVPEVIARARRSGVSTAATRTDAHWNPRGHAIAADLLDSALARLLPPLSAR